jgi:hypothetical protein
MITVMAVVIYIMPIVLSCTRYYVCIVNILVGHIYSTSVY